MSKFLPYNSVVIPLLIISERITLGLCLTSKIIFPIYSPINEIAKRLMEPKERIKSIIVVVPFGAISGKNISTQLRKTVSSTKKATKSHNQDTLL